MRDGKLILAEGMHAVSVRIAVHLLALLLEVALDIRGLLSQINQRLEQMEKGKET